MTTQETIERIASKINKLPLIDSEVVGIITLLNNPASNFEQIVEKLSPSLAARFLNIANSAYYGGREVRSINYAVQLLGYGKMKDILITSILMDHFTRRLQDFDFDKFLKQAQFCAVVAKVIGEILTFNQQDDLFTVATLQNIGKMVIAVYFKDEHKQIVALKKAEGLPTCKAEKRILGISHGKIGAIVLQRFNVPKEICEAVEFHDRLDTELPLENDNYLQHIARQATAIVGQFSLPKEIATMDLYHMLRATVEQGKRNHREQVLAQLRLKGYQEIFPSLLEKAADLVVNDLKAHLRQRVSAIEFVADTAYADEK
ncbi:MAG: HDOD domain-containing protein [Desulfobacterales bacterium]|nr:HDOD domain-containing protein [Desulfobacterales bacterium]